jgi:large subunit ribosomal protein L10
MNRDEKAVAIAEIAGKIDESEAVFAVDYRGITVEQVAELRAKLRPAEATFKVVKNSLTERAADEAGAESLKDYLSGPTALTFVRGDAATAAKALADYAKATQLLPFKGGLMEGGALDVEQIRALSKLPSREVLYGQLVGIVASPVGGLVRSLNALLGGLAVALGQVQAKKESGEIPSGDAPAAAQPEPAAEESAAEPAADAEAAAEEPAADAEPAAEEPAAEPAGDAEPSAGADAEGESGLDGEAAAAPAEDDKTEEPAPEQPAAEDDNQADVSAEEPTDAETKED